MIGWETLQDGIKVLLIPAALEILDALNIFKDWIFFTDLLNA